MSSSTFRAAASFTTAAILRLDLAFTQSVEPIQSNKTAAVEDALVAKYVLQEGSLPAPQETGDNLHIPS